jgi:NTP pyrophosphatase (non-canonical NTP hydrolase)
MLEPLFAITDDLTRRFPEGNQPYQIMTRLLEQCGELAQYVNHLEDSGLKHLKYGPPQPEQIAKEIKDIIRAALQVARYYGLEAALEASFTASYQAIPSSTS